MMEGNNTASSRVGPRFGMERGDLPGGSTYAILRIALFSNLYFSKSINRDRNGRQ